LPGFHLPEPNVPLNKARRSHAILRSYGQADLHWEAHSPRPQPCGRSVRDIVPSSPSNVPD
jgi:hypothetical protein